MAYDGSLKFDTKIDQSGFEKGVKQLGSVANTAFKAIGTAIAGTGAALIGIGAAATKVGSEFEAGMSQVAATMGISAQAIREGDDTFQALEKAARDAGATTMFSATEASEALNYLALAGYDAEKAIDALPKVLNLASAGGLELGYAANIATNSMNALGLETDDLGGFIDELAVASQKSGTDVSQLGEAILTVGGTAKSMKGGTVELSTQLGILADAGIKGAEGGTALRNVLLALSAPTEKQAKELKRLGVETYDSNGKLRGTNEIFQDLEKTLGTMSDKERTEVLSTLFNKVDLKAANALLDNSGERFNELSKQIANSDGAAERMAETLNDNLRGKIEILKSGLSELGIQIYQGIDTPLKNATEAAIGYVEQLSNAFDDGGFAGLVAELGNIVADVLINIAAQMPKLIDMGKEMVLSFTAGIKANRSELMQSVSDILISFISSIYELLPEVFETGIALLQSLGRGIIESLPDLIDTAQESIMTLITIYIDSLPLLTDIGIEIISMIILGITEMIPELIDAGVWLFMTLVETIMDNIPVLLDTAVEIINTLVTGLTENLPAILDMAMTMVMTLMDGIIDNVDNLVEAAIEIVDALIAFITDNLDTIIEFTLEIVMAIIDGLINNLDQLIDAAVHLVTAIVEGLINNLPLLVNAAIRLVLGIIDGLFQALPQLVSAGIKLISELIGTVLRLIPQFVSIGLQLVGELVIGIVRAVPTVLRAGVQLVKTIGTGIKSGFTGIVGIGKDMVRGLWEGIKGMASWISNKVKGFAQGITNSFKGVLGIRSPSKLFKDEIGENLTLGIGLGIEEGMPDLQRDIDKEMAALTNKMKATVDMESAGIGTRISANSIGTASQTITVDTTNDNEKIDYERLGEATVRAFVRSGIGISVNNREFGRLVADSLGERRG